MAAFDRLAQQARKRRTRRQFTVTKMPNRVNYSLPNVSITSGAQTGTINSAGPARSVVSVDKRCKRDAHF